jgi:hypothetical protein
MRRARACEYCGTAYRPKHATSRFCSRQCRKLSHEPPIRLYTYNGRLSDALWREIHAARAEMATAPLYRPGGVG